MATPKTPLQAHNAAVRSLFLAVISVVVAIVALIGAGLAWYQLSLITGGIKQTGQHTQTQLQSMRDQQHQTQQQILNLQNQLNQVAQTSTQIRRQRTLGKTAYFLHLANLHLTVGHDTSTALNLMRLAKDQIDELNDSSVLVLKRAIQRDIEKLQNAPQVDITKISIQLDSIDNAIGKLQISPKKQLPDVSPLTKSGASAQHWYQKLAHKLAGLDDLIKIRRLDKPVMPLLTPEQLLLLKEKMQLQVTHAEWALLHGNPKIYQLNLKNIIATLTDYFNPSQQIGAIIKQLKKLASINIAPQLPDLNESLTALSKIDNNSGDTKTSPQQPNNKKPSSSRSNERITASWYYDYTETSSASSSRGKIAVFPLEIPHREKFSGNRCKKPKEQPPHPPANPGVAI